MRKEKVVLIPGASRPLGRAIARLFGEHSCRLVLPYFSDWPESTEEMKQEFSDRKYDFLACPCDLTTIDETDRLIQEITSHFGRLDYLINNIERGGMPVLHGSYNKEINRNQWNLEFDTTLKAKWNLFTSAIDLLKQVPDTAVINISSIAGHTGRSGPAALLFNDGYSAANRGIELLTQTWARQAAPSVRVNEVMVGLIDGRHGNGTRGWSLLSAVERQQLEQRTLLNRTGTPEEVAEVVYFLCTSAQYITGSVIRVDGGYCLGADRVDTIVNGIL
ncbi:MAG: 3-oxoacyl-ACP reductase [Proteobacteria bacterium]|nr:MAG: 3-oxoacyl-ACP reductase [Pseudomonadota bacterium]PIE64629.1 MAG: 3-oxoacyl-ACP reductase [Desulfobacterales bacterium]